MYYSIESKLDLPKKYVVKKIEDFYVVLAYEIPSWIILTPDEYHLFSFYNEKLTIKEILENFQKESNLYDDVIIEIMQTLLEKIEYYNFFSTAISNDSEEIEEITKRIQLHITNACNISCTHCYLSSGKKWKNELCQIEWLSILDSINSEYGKTEVVFTGGEPLAKKYTLELLKHSFSLGNKNILFSNGLLINTKNILEIKKYVSEIQISCEGISEKKFEEVRGKGTYFQFNKTIETILENNISLTLAITIMGNSFVEDLNENLLSFLEMHKPKKINVRINEDLEKTGNALYLDDKYFIKSTLDRMNVTNLIKKLSEEYDFQGKQSTRNSHFKNCGIGASIHISPDGSVYPCSNWNCDFGNIKTKSINNVIKDFNQLNKKTEFTYFPKCNSCELKYICSGGCRIKNKTETGSFILPICDKKYKDNKYRELLLDFQRDYKNQTA